MVQPMGSTRRKPIVGTVPSPGARLALLLGTGLLVLAACGEASSVTPPTIPPPTSSGASTSDAGSPAPSKASGTPSGAPPSSTIESSAAGGSGTDPGAVAATAAAIGENTLPPVPADEPATFGEGLEVRAVDQRTTELTAMVPGEISGPGVVVTLAFHNGTGAPVDLDGVRVNAYDALGAPATEIELPDADPPSGLLAPGADAEGTFAFSMAGQDVGAMRLEITSTGSSDVVVLTG